MVPIAIVSELALLSISSLVGLALPETAPLPNANALVAYVVAFVPVAIESTVFACAALPKAYAFCAPEIELKPIAAPFDASGAVYAFVPCAKLCLPVAIAFLPKATAASSLTFAPVPIAIASSTGAFVVFGADCESLPMVILFSPRLIAC